MRRRIGVLLFSSRGRRAARAGHVDLHEREKTIASVDGA
jgi:hypothetical protein